MIHTVASRPQNIVKYTVGLSMTLKDVLRMKVLSMPNSYSFPYLNNYVEYIVGFLAVTSLLIRN